MITHVGDQDIPPVPRVRQDEGIANADVADVPRKRIGFLGGGGRLREGREESSQDDGAPEQNLPHSRILLIPNRAIAKVPIVSTKIVRDKQPAFCVLELGNVAA